MEMDYDANKKWEPYETSDKRDYTHRPVSSIPSIMRPKTSGRIFRNSYALEDPVGMTSYSEDFSWRPVSKTACIRSATASGNRRNNPHPSQAFMVWRQLKYCDARSPLQLLLTEKQIQKALSAPYRSTYRTDFLGLPQGIMRNHAIFAPLNCNHVVHYYTQTEMRDNYRPPDSKPELLGSKSRYGCNKLHGRAARGIVPAVVHSLINNQENSQLQTTYNKHFGREHTDVSSVLKSIPATTAQQFFSDKEKKDMKSLHVTSSAHGCKVKNTAFKQTPSTLERMSAWPGPL